MTETSAANVAATRDLPTTPVSGEEALAALVQALRDARLPHDRVRTIRLLQMGTTMIERQVLHDAQASGMSWAQIGDVYGVTRQAVHRRFAEPAVMSPEAFDELLASLDEPRRRVPPRSRRPSGPAAGRTTTDG